MKSKLAKFGGDKAITLDYKTHASIPLVSQKGLDDVVEMVKAGDISMSPKVYDFEDKFAKYNGNKYAIAANNGTATLHMALHAVGVKHGDEVITPSFTFWATMVPILAQLATPVFCDLDKDSPCVDAADIERKITPKTKAIMIVHCWGYSCDMDAIMAVAKKHNVKVIEDASHAHTTKYKGKNMGVIGDIGCFSMQASKLLVGGEAGIFVTDSREYYERALAMADYARLVDLPEDSEYRKYTLTGMGVKYRPHPLAIAIANASLDEMDERAAVRDANARRLNELLSDIPWLNPPKEYQDTYTTYAYHHQLFDNSKFGDICTLALLKVLAAEGVDVGYCGYGRLHQSPIILEGGPQGNLEKRDKPVSLPVTENFAKNVFLAAPRFEKECAELIEQYSLAYHKVNDNMDEVIEYAKNTDFTEEYKSLGGRTIVPIK